MSDWEGVDAMFATLDDIEAAADKATRELVTVTSIELVAASQRNFVGAHRPGEPHRGGNKPNIVTGNLRRSIRSDPLTRYARADYGTSVGPRMIYGRRVELGFRGSRGYPYFMPAARILSEGYRLRAANIWAKHMRQAT